MKSEIEELKLFRLNWSVNVIVTIKIKGIGSKISVNQCLESAYKILVYLFSCGSSPLIRLLGKNWLTDVNKKNNSVVSSLRRHHDRAYSPHFLIHFFNFYFILFPHTFSYSIIYLSLIHI